MLALSQECILIMYLHCFSLASLMYIDALMFMLMQCTYMTRKHLIFSPLLPLILPLFLFCCRSVNCKLFSGLSFLSFRHDDKHKKSWAPDFRVERKFAKVTCRPLLCCQARWWRPGRVETSCRSGGWTSSSSACPPRALLVVRASLTDPSLSFCSKHTLKRMVLSVRLFVQADLVDLYTIVTNRRRRRFNWQGVTQ